MKNLQKFLSVAAMLLVSVCAFAQSMTVKGVVTDGTGEPLVGVHVFVKGTNAGVITDVAGEFAIDAKANDVLVASYLGYKDAEVVVTGAKATIVLTEDSEFLEEVVVLGYGVNARRKDLSASVGVISNAEKLVERPVATVNDMLQGQLAGVVVSSNGGDPSSTPNIVIRGQGSRNGDSVLWVVDGVPGGPIPSPNEIESIVVLKDAASAAIYGAQSGAGGVILVTTKKATKGDVQISYEGIIGTRKPTNVIQPLDASQEIEMRRISYANSGMTLPDGWNVGKNPYVATTRTNWMDEIFQTAIYKRHNVTLNGGNDKVQSRLTFSFMDNPGTLRCTYRKNLAVRYNVNYKINDYISISEDVSWINKQSRGADTNSGHSGIIASALFMPPSATVYNPLDGTYGGTVNENPAYAEKWGSNFADIHGDAINPVRMLEADNRFHKTNELWSTTNLNIANIVKGLKFNSRFTYKLYNSFQKTFTPIRDEIGKPELKNKLYLHSARNDDWNWENTLSYDQTFGKHAIGALASVTADSFIGRWMQIEANSLPDESDYLQYVKYAENATPNDGLDGPDANISFVGRLSYAYDQRYFLTASFRRDYAGRLPEGHNFGDFPAVTAAWKISNEEFFPQNDIVNMLKLRASWGRVGNLGSIWRNYKSSTLSTWTRDYISSIGTELGNGYGLAVYNNNAVNTELTWETSEQMNVGLDFDMFKEKLQVSVDFFNKRTYNLIQDQPMNWPGSIGLDAMKVNLGEIRNRGIELQASWNDKIGKDWSYFVTGNFAYLKNWISDIGVKNSDGEPGTWVGGGDFLSIPWVYQTTQGLPIDSFYLIKTDGIFQSDEEAAAYITDEGERIQPDAKAGDLKFVDFNKDGKIDDKDRQYMGGATPTTTFAFSFGATWKNLSVSAMLQGVGGAQAVNVAKYITHSDAGGNFNRSVATLDAWSPTNTDSTTPRLMRNDPNQNFTRASDWYLEDASYLRLKNVTISYDFTSLLQKAKHFSNRGSRASIYFSGENLLTFTKYSGMDPECGGWDALKYPVSRVLSLGVKITY